MNRNDFRDLARVRLDEAGVLLAAGHYAGAYYLAGYAVECALKACIAKQTRAGDFPDLDLARASYTHDLERLLSVAGLKDELKAALRSDSGFEIYWNVVSRWGAHSRYSLATEGDTRDLYAAISNRRHGVLRWLRRFS